MASAQIPAFANAKLDGLAPSAVLEYAKAVFTVFVEPPMTAGVFMVMREPTAVNLQVTLHVSTAIRLSQTYASVILAGQAQFVMCPTALKAVIMVTALMTKSVNVFRASIPHKS